MKKGIFLLILAMFVFVNFANAQEVEEPKLDYGEGPILDSDLDGLTDLGEEKLFGTSVTDPDSDGDGMLDGAEVIGKSDPLDASYPRAKEVVTEKTTHEHQDAPWLWYVIRATGIVAFLLLFFSMLFGFFIRIPVVNKIFNYPNSLEIHKWVSIYAVLFAFAHGFLTIFDEFLSFSLLDSFVPFFAEWETTMVGLGIFAFYLMILLVVSSLLRKKISNKVWRFIHYFNVVLYVFVAIHAFFLGSEMKIEWVRATFLALNGLLFVVFLVNIFFRARLFAKRLAARRAQSEKT